MQDEKLIATALSRLETLKRQEAFDPMDLNSRPTEKQQQVISEFGKFKQVWIRSGNQSGKSQTCARIVTWILTDTFPGWTRPIQWGNEPLLVIIAGRTGKQIEDSLLPKLRGFLPPNTYKEVRVGNIVQRIELNNGNRIVFQSLENPNTARERLMSYVAHITWCDELPPTIDLVRELLVRTQARNGYNLFSFTPTVVSREVQAFVDRLTEPEARIYRFSMLDNPLYSDPIRKQELVNRYSHLSETLRNAVFEGDWVDSDNLVYHFDWNTMVEMPTGYSPMWRHVESVDPAMSSALGLTVWAENPTTGVWYCVIAQYVKGILVPTDIVKAVRDITKDLNIVRRTSDYAPWYVNTASSMGITYMTVQGKNAGRKDELIKGLQQSLSSGRIRVAPHCQDLVTELEECRWSDRTEGKMVNSSSYHLLDSAQYFVDVIPRRETTITYSSHDDYLYQANELRKIEKHKKEKKKQLQIARRMRPWKRA